MTLDNEDQRIILLQALTNVTIQTDYKSLCELFPKMQATVEAVKVAKVESNGLGAGMAQNGSRAPGQPAPNTNEVTDGTQQ